LVYIINLIFVGLLADDSLKDLDLPAEEKRKFRVNCRNFYIAVTDHFQARFDFDDPYFQCCHLELPENARKADPKLFSSISKRVHLLKGIQSLAERKWRQNALFNKSNFNRY
jgi:hypothetical protein